MKRNVESELNSGKGHNIHSHFSQKKSDVRSHYDLNQKKVQLMGILNCTPDSFFDGGFYDSVEKLVERGREIEKEGADLIDVGGESTRPFAKKISIETELKRVIPVISSLSKVLSIPTSIDTRNAEVAIKAIESGAGFLNDVSGFTDERMRKIAAESQLPICLMHSQGSPETMQLNPSYPQGVIVEMLQWFKKQVDCLLKAGVSTSKICIDPGIGFGKTVEDNCSILRNLSAFKELGFPLFIGLSRKSFQSKIVGKPSRDLLSTTVSLNTMSILEGASIIRVHDVKEHRDALNVLACVLK